jgi:hypothetical protein
VSALKNSKPTNPLRSVSDIRRFFHRNETPIYFISATNFNLLGAEEWVKGFKFICYMDCFDRQYPNVVVPKEMSARRAWPRREA